MESNPHFSPDGKWIAFNSNRSGNDAVYIVSVEGGQSKRLTWHPSPSMVRGWSSDGKRILYATSRDNAPAGSDRLWTVSMEGGPSAMLTSQWSTDGSFSPDGRKIIIDRVTRWDKEWRNYRGGQNTALVILDLKDYTEMLFPYESTIDVTRSAGSVSLSPTGKRVILEARGEIFTVPAENGDARNITNTSGAADHAPIWSPKGNEVAWFSDADRKGYALLITSQDGLSRKRSIPIGESKMAWEPVWSPDGKLIAFVDNKVRVRIVDIVTGTIMTADTGRVNIERGNMGLTWSHDSRWLAYTKTGLNNFRQIIVWSAKDNSTHSFTNSFADSHSPAWDKDGHHLYFLASTELALGSGWANTSSITADPDYKAYIINLRKGDPSPFKPRSDEEGITEEKKPDTDIKKPSKVKQPENKSVKDSTALKNKEPETVLVDFENIERRTVALPLPRGNYRLTISGPPATLFIGEQKPNASGLVIHKFTLEKRETKEYVTGASQVSISSDGQCGF